MHESCVSRYRFTFTYSMYVMYVCTSVGHKLDMGDGSSGFHSVLPAHRPRVGPLRLSVVITAPLRVVFVETADVAVSQFQVKHCETGM